MINTFQKDKNGKIIPSIENFYKFCGEGKLMGVICQDCHLIHIIPRSICTKCQSINMDWIELKRNGKLLSYSIVHVSTPEFQHQTPYAVGIIELEEGVRLSGIIRDAKQEDLKIGMDLVIDFEENTSQEWPRWSRYVFKTR